MDKGVYIVLYNICSLCLITPHLDWIIPWHINFIHERDYRQQANCLHNLALIALSKIIKNWGDYKSKLDNNRNLL